MNLNIDAKEIAGMIVEDNLDVIVDELIKYLLDQQEWLVDEIARRVLKKLSINKQDIVEECASETLQALDNWRDYTEEVREALVEKALNNLDLDVRLIRGGNR